MKVEETVPAALDGERLDRVVSLIADISRSDATKLIADGGTEIDGSVVTSGKSRLKEGQTVVVDLDKIPVPVLPGPDASVVLDVVYVDDDIIVINKDAGVVVHPASGHGNGTLVNGILAVYPEVATVGQPGRPGIVHRLDSGTTGMMVVARTQRAYDSLVAALQDHEVGREYLHIRNRSNTSDSCASWCSRSSCCWRLDVWRCTVCSRCATSDAACATFDVDSSRQWRRNDL